jgi:hypothetical protein
VYGNIPSRETSPACVPDTCVARVTVFLLAIVGIVVAVAPAFGQAATRLSWDPPAAGVAASYVVQWGPAPGEYLGTAIVPAGDTSFEARGLRPGLRYYFAVRAIDAEGHYSGFSNEVVVVAAPADARGTGAGAPAATSWPDVLLEVRSEGTGEGTVATSPSPTEPCGPSCAVSLPGGTRVTLVATATAGSRFAGWQGAGCESDATCTFRLGEPTMVVARFERDASPSPSTERYLAEGAVSGFFDTRIALANPGAVPATASLQFLRGDGGVVVHEATLPPLSSTHVDAASVPGLSGQAFATVVTSNTPLVVDRTMSWRGANGFAYGAHAETSVAGPAPRWYLAEGATHAGFDLFYLLQNPNDFVVRARIRYLRPVGAPLEKVYTLPARSRTSVWVDKELIGTPAARLLANTEVSAVVDALDGAGIVVERAMYDTRRGVTFEAGHESAGITSPAERWYFAEGATGPYFDLFLLIANPGTTRADVRVTYLLPNGRRVVRSHQVGPAQRYTIWVDQEGDLLADTAVSAIVETTNGVPVVAERSMWWPGDSTTWLEAHNSPGATAVGTRWAVADGDVQQGRLGRSTYLLVANVSSRVARVRVTLLFRAGVPAMVREFLVTGGSRFGISVGDDFPEAVGRQFGALIESVGENPASIVVERAMYADAPGQPWASGTNLLATRLP